MISVVSVVSKKTFVFWGRLRSQITQVPCVAGHIFLIFKVSQSFTQSFRRKENVFIFCLNVRITIERYECKVIFVH